MTMALSVEGFAGTTQYDDSDAMCTVFNDIIECEGIERANIFLSELWDIKVLETITKPDGTTHKFLHIEIHHKKILYVLITNENVSFERLYRALK
jgi:hypothetical protein